jgi:glycosyltransferase involved in cell wall biosynthesis
MTKISVLMCVCDGQNHIQKCIESILEQTFENFEFLILDDASIDQTSDIIKSYLKDKRIKLYKNEQNLGLTKSLNILLSASQGQYIARIDADDTAKKTRLQTQVSLLEKEKAIGMVASNCDLIDENSNYLYTHCPPCNDTALRWSMIFRNPIRHSTVMFRNKLFSKTSIYDVNFKYAQDYEMWQRIGSYFRIGIIPETLGAVRIHEKTISNKIIENQDEFVNLISRKQMENYYGKPISLEEANKIRMMYVHRNSIQLEKMKKIDIKDFNHHIHFYFDIALGFLNSSYSLEKKILIKEIKLDIKSLINIAKSKPGWSREIVKSIKKWIEKQKRNQFIDDLERTILINKFY